VPEVDIIPAELDQLTSAQAVAIGDQYSRGIPMSLAVVAGHINQLLDFTLG
jgi:hypothetical protein